MKLDDDMIRTFARRLSRNVVGAALDAEDLYQVGRLACLVGGEKTFVYGAMIGELRRMSRNLSQEWDQRRCMVSLSEIEGLSASFLSPEFIVMLYQHIATWPPTWQAIFQGRVAGHTAEEMSQQIGLSIGSINQYSHRLRKNLSQEVL